MFRRSIAGLILGPALLIGSLAWSGFLALRTVFEPDRSRAIAEELLDNDQVRAQLTENLGSAIEAALPEGAPVSGRLIDDTARTVLDDPRVESLILDALSSTHSAFLGEGDAPESLDLGPVIESARESLGATSPAMASLLPAAETFEVDLPTEHIPDAGPVRRFLQNAVPYLAAIAAVGALLALVSTSDRPSILRRAARWALVTTAFYLVIGLGVPWLLRELAPDQAEVLAALLAAVLRSTLVPSIVLAVGGVALLLAAAFWPDRNRDRERERPPRQEAGAQPTAPAPRPASPSPVGPAAPIPRVVAPPPAPNYRPPMPTSSAPPRSAPGDASPPSGPAHPPLRTREGRNAAPRVGDTDERERWLPPKWIEGHGWVLDPDDPKPPPANARWVDGVGFVVPGPPPSVDR